MKFRPFRGNVSEWCVAMFMWLGALLVVWMTIVGHTGRWWLAVAGIAFFTTAGLAAIER